MQNKQGYEIPFKGTLKFTPIDSPLIGYSYSVNYQDLVKSQSKDNIYSIMLDNWYNKFFNDIKRYQQTVPCSLNVTPQHFTEVLRTVTLDFGRKTGASGAISDFINKHPNLNIRVITVLHTLRVEIENNITLENPSKYFDLYDIPFEDIDIIFIDNAPLFKPNPKQTELLMQLNSGSNKNQWIIKLGN